MLVSRDRAPVRTAAGPRRRPSVLRNPCRRSGICRFDRAGNAGTRQLSAGWVRRCQPVWGRRGSWAHLGAPRHGRGAPVGSSPRPFGTEAAAAWRFGGRHRPTGVPMVPAQRHRTPGCSRRGNGPRGPSGYLLWLQSRPAWLCHGPRLSITGQFVTRTQSAPNKRRSRAPHGHGVRSAGRHPGPAQ